MQGIIGHSQNFPHKTRGEGKGLQTPATSSFHPLFEFCLKGRYAKKYQPGAYIFTLINSLFMPVYRMIIKKIRRPPNM